MGKRSGTGTFVTAPPQGNRYRLRRGSAPEKVSSEANHTPPPATRRERGPGQDVGD